MYVWWCCVLLLWSKYEVKVCFASKEVLAVPASNLLLQGASGDIWVDMSILLLLFLGDISMLENARFRKSGDGICISMSYTYKY